MKVLTLKNISGLGSDEEQNYLGENIYPDIFETHGYEIAQTFGKKKQLFIRCAKRVVSWETVSE